MDIRRFHHNLVRITQHDAICNIRKARQFIESVEEEKSSGDWTKPENLPKVKDTLKIFLDRMYSFFQDVFKACEDSMFFENVKTFQETYQKIVTPCIDSCSQILQTFSDFSEKAPLKFQRAISALERACAKIPDAFDNLLVALEGEKEISLQEELDKIANKFEVATFISIDESARNNLTLNLGVLKSVISNLFDNSKTQLDEERPNISKIYVKAAIEDGKLVVNVTDTAKAIDETKVKGLFSNTSIHGLSTCESFVTELGGSLKLAAEDKISEKPEESIVKNKTFILTMPYRA